eukprot:2762235-Pyramimonas_sp.AAC.1
MHSWGCPRGRVSDDEHSLSPWTLQLVVASTVDLDAACHSWPCCRAMDLASPMHLPLGQCSLVLPQLLKPILALWPSTSLLHSRALRAPGPGPCRIRPKAGGGPLTRERADRQPLGDVIADVLRAAHDR